MNYFIVLFLYIIAAVYFCFMVMMVCGVLYAGLCCFTYTFLGIELPIL